MLLELLEVFEPALIGLDNVDAVVSQPMKASRGSCPASNEGEAAPEEPEVGEPELGGSNKLAAEFEAVG